MGSTVTMDCLACRNPITFEPGRVSTRCRICEEDRPLPVRIAPEIPEIVVDAPAPAPESLAGRTLGQCSACRAVLSAPGAIGMCPQCQAEVGPLASAPAVLRPQGQLRFLLDEEAARKAVQERFMRVKDAGGIPRLHRMYVPWLLMSCSVKGTFDGLRGEREQAYSKHGTRYYVTWTQVSGAFDRKWEYRRRCGSVGIVADLAEQLEPCDWAFTEPYDLEALGDVVVEHCTSTPAEIIRRIVPDFMAGFQHEARTGIGGDLQQVGRVDAQHFDDRVRVVMMPVWIGRPAPDKAVIVHGRTGAVALRGYTIVEPDDSLKRTLLDLGEGLVITLVVFGIPLLFALVCEL